MAESSLQDEMDCYRFRGEFLHWLAIVEDHINPAVQRLVDMGVYKKSPYLFGQKFGAATRSTETAEVWTHPQHVGPILSALKPYVELRSLIAHGLIEAAQIGDRTGISIRPSGRESWETRKVITANECDQMLKELKKLADRLTKQRLKPINPPSSPPPPSPGGAGGP